MRRHTSARNLQQWVFLIFTIFIFRCDEFRNQGRNSDTFEDFFDLLKTVQSSAESIGLFSFKNIYLNFQKTGAIVDLSCTSASSNPLLPVKVSDMHTVVIERISQQNLNLPMNFCTMERGRKGRIQKGGMKNGLNKHFPFLLEHYLP